MRTTICVAKNRPSCEPALKLLLLSLTAHSPSLEINLFYPPATPEFFAWMKKCPQVRFQTGALANASGWNVKPVALMQMLQEGFEQVIWVDTDIVVKKDLVPLFAPVGEDAFVVCEDGLGDERDDRNALRARLWGFPVGRVLPFGLNSGVLRVTGHHHGLLRRWWELLQSSEYLEAQKLRWRQRPFHLLGDQDVLTALLTSKYFSEIRLSILRRGKHIIQFNGVYGYTVVERVRNLLSDGPTFVHSPGGKPWSEEWRRETGLRESIKSIYLDLSPYTLSALTFRKGLECDADWMDPHYAFSRILRKLGVGHPALAGLPLSLLLEVPRSVKSRRPSAHLELSLSALSQAEAGRHSHDLESTAEGEH